MSHHILSTDEEDPFEYAFITKDTLEASLDVIRKSFCVNENICIAVELQRDPYAVNEIVELAARIVKDGISLVAIDKKSKHVVGACFNKLQVKSSDQDKFLEEFASECKCASAKTVLQFLIDANSVADLFNLCKVDCILEIMIMSVLSDYRRNRIASKLTELSISIAKDLSLGKNIKVPINNEILSLEPIPQAISTMCTSYLTQMIASRLNHSIAADISYEKFIFEGKTFASRIGPKSPTARIVYGVL